jgi:hypothetical protein
MVALVSGCANLLPVPDSCRVLRAGGPGQGARSARRGPAVAAPQAPLTRAARERIMPGLRGQGGSGQGVGGLSAWFAVLAARGGRPWRPGQGEDSQPYLGARGLGVAPAT